MKKAVKISIISIVSVFLILLLIPFAFQAKIKTKVQNEINKNINAKVGFGKVGLSLIKNFPDMTLKINDLSIVGVNEFASDTLASIGKLLCTIDLMSIINGDVYKIKQIKASEPSIYLRVLTSGQANWDIAKQSEDTVGQSETSFKAMLDKVELTQASITYDDAELPALLIFKGINGTMGGDMTIDITRLQIDADIDEVTMDYEGVRYLSKVKAKLSTMLDADLANWKFTFAKGLLKLNDLELLADGFFAMPDTGYNMDIKFAAKQNTFKSFLSLVPGIYSKDFKELKSSGTLQLDGFVKGWYTDVLIPAFALNVKIDNGSFAYPSLPGSVDQIKLNAHITNPDGIMDHTEVLVNQLHFSMMNNPVDIMFKALTPVSDPYIDAAVKGTINLSDVQKVYPMQNVKIAGEMVADMTFRGNISAIEKSAYDKFYAAGFANISNMIYEGTEVARPVRISNGRLDFDPASARLSNLSVVIGNSDLRASGMLGNYIPYLMKKNAVLKGALTIQSDNLDFNNILTTSTESKGDSPATNSPVIIPPDIDFVLDASINRLQYDNYDLSAVKGVVKVANRQLQLNGLQAGVLGGNVILNGSYSTFSDEQPKVDMDLQINKIELKEAFSLSEMIRKYIPVASKLTGAINTKLKLKGKLTNEMMPELTSISAYGLLLSDLVGIKDINTFNRISDVLKIDKLRNPSLQKINLSFDILDGKATVKPMDFKLGGYNANFSGTTSLDQTLNFVLNLEIPRSDFGAQANGVLNKMVSEASGKGVNIKLGDIVPVTILIGGTASDPKITTGIKNAMTNLVEDIKNQAVAQIEKKKEELVAKAKEEATSLITKADAEAAKLIAEAEKQSQKLIQTAAAAAQKVRFAADSTASRVVAEGKKNGYIAEIAAKKAAEKVKKEGYEKANKIEAEAGKQSDAVLLRARSEAEKLKKEALDRVK